MTHVIYYHCTLSVIAHRLTCQLVQLILAWIPTWAFGRRFVEGKSVERVPETNLAILLGTFGSAFTATLADYYKEVRPLLNKAMSDSMDTYIKEVMCNRSSKFSTLIAPLRSSITDLLQNYIVSGWYESHPPAFALVLPKSNLQVAQPRAGGRAFLPAKEHLFERRRNGQQPPSLSPASTWPQYRRHSGI